ncbi:MAG: cellulase family glycosylhydrolase, partial [Kiritimatiellae bacterium]|nr:cellulase family glycosylhydrolase [Kiritimatiellia bacterium]
LTDRTKFDTDGDGIGDGEELMIDGTDPLDIYSARPPDRLRASGASIVDESGNPVVLCAENYGGWLAWEHWMLKFEPQVHTNILGNVVGIRSGLDGASCNELVDLLVDNVDASITLLATKASWTNSAGIETNTNPDSIGGFNSGSWLCFSNVVFSPGLTNLAVIYGRLGTETAGAIEIRLGNPTSGTVIKSFKTADTGGWYDYDENIFYGVQSVAASTQNVYIVGTGAGGLGNFYSFRLYKTDNTDFLINRFRTYYFNTNDLDRLRALGCNTIRLPFNYDLLLDATGTNWLTNGWAWLDQAVEECAKRRMWCLLDLHAAPGGQNWYEQCAKKQGTRNRLWAVQKYQDQLNRLWSGVSARYATNPAVLGYDLLNEPYPYAGDNSVASMCAAYTNYLIPLHNRLYKTIRSNDTAHLIFMEDNFHGTNNAAFLWVTPEPAAMGWSNIVYEFHSYERVLNSVYTGALAYLNWEYETQKQVADDNVRNCVRFMRARQVPVFLGEFQPGDPQNDDYALRRYTENGINWCHWNYKVWGWEDTNRPDHGWNSWGLAYRQADVSDDFPNIVTDNLASLVSDFADYGSYTNYDHLQQVYASRAASAQAAVTNTTEFTDFYLNTFDGPDANSINESWAWRKLTAIGNADGFLVRVKKARLDYNYGTSFAMRLKSREETEAHFNIMDATGVEMSVDVCAFNISSAAGGTDTELCLSMTRDMVTNTVYSYDSTAIMARMQYNGSTTNVKISLHAKGETANSFGTTLYESAWVAFSPSGTLKLAVNQSAASVTYPGVASGSISHGLSFTNWTDGGLAVVDARNVSGHAIYAEFDNLKVERPSAARDTAYANSFDDIPDEMQLRALPDSMSVFRSWSSSRFETTFITNSRVIVMPNDGTWQGTWLNPTRNYQNAARMDFQASSLVNISVNYSDFTQGVAKICFLPEDFPAEIWGHYENKALYVEMWRSGANLAFASYRHLASGDSGRDCIGPVTNYTTYADGCAVSVTVSTNALVVTYDGETVLNLNHGVNNMTNLYRHGMYPHFEFQNDGSSTHAVVGMDEIAVSSAN